MKREGCQSPHVALTKKCYFPTLTTTSLSGCSLLLICIGIQMMNRNFNLVFPSVWFVYFVCLYLCLPIMPVVQEALITNNRLRQGTSDKKIICPDVLCENTAASSLPLQNAYMATVAQHSIISVREIVVQTCQMPWKCTESESTDW